MHQGRNAMSSFLSKEPPLGGRASRSSSFPSKKLRVVLLAAPALLAVTQFLRTQVEEFPSGPLKTKIQGNFDFERTVPERFELALEELPTHACTRQRVRQPPAGQPGRLEPDLPLLGRTALPHTTTLPPDSPRPVLRSLAREEYCILYQHSRARYLSYPRVRENHNIFSRARETA